MRSDSAFLEAANARRHGVVDLLADLIHTPSVSTEEGAVVERLRHAMVDFDFDEVFVDAFGSIIGRIGNGPTTIVYDSHIDTVGVGSRSEWAADPFEPRITGGLHGVIHGRGASDNKAGIAAMVCGAALYRDLGYTDEVTLYVVGSVQEEDCDGLALEHVLTQVLPRPDLVVLGEATNCDVYRGNRGRIEALVRTRGSSCHASAPDRGHNPVYDLAGVVSDIARLNSRLGYDDFLGAGTIALTKIECETPSLNAVPATATLYVDRRLTIGETPAAALAEIRALPSVQAVGGEVELLRHDRTSYTGKTLSQEKAFQTWVTPADSPGVESALRAGELALGRRPGLSRWVFSTNGVASMGKLGLPTVGFGPGDEVHAHTVHDQCPIDDLVQAMAWYAAFPDVFAQARTSAAAESFRAART